MNIKRFVSLLIAVLISFLLIINCANEPIGACVIPETIWEERICDDNLTEKECADYDKEAEWYSGEICEDRKQLEGAN
ncbi:MAG: hypothetical protein OEZ22_04575 [Spirochaetia bacterium]|nr:hypothetical protein [Spirochaetia bacterium]